MTIKVHGLAQATCTKRVLTVLAEKNIPYELVEVDVMKGEHKQEPYLKKHPFGVIPVLEDDGFFIYESRAICRYLEVKFKGQGTELIPTELKAYGLFEQGAYVESSNFSPSAEGVVYELFFKNLRGLSADAEKAKQHTEKLASVLDVYEKILSKQEYIGGSTFTIADIYHLPYASLLFAINLGHLITDRPHVNAWWQRISSRPSWQKVNAPLK